MADIPNITDLDVLSWLRRARKEPDPVAYLEGLNTAATDAIAGGDEYVEVLTSDGTSSQQKRDINARFLQHVTELCLQRLAAEEAAGGADKMTSINSIRIGAFS